MNTEPTPAMGSETTKELESYCVISPTVNAEFGRTWKLTQAAAEAHAKKLVQGRNSYRGQKPAKLLVVKVVSVVELEGPPVSIRSLEADDVGSDA